MEIDDWPVSRLNWEPIGKNGMATAIFNEFIWITGKDGRTQCMTFDTARELAEWIQEELDRHAKQVTTTAKVDARSSGWDQATQGWTFEERRKGVRSSRP